MPEGFNIGDIFVQLGGNATNLKAALDEARAAADKAGKDISAAFATIGVNDLEGKFRRANAAFNTLSDALDKGLISQNQYSSATRAFNGIANQYADEISGAAKVTRELADVQSRLGGAFKTLGVSDVEGQFRKANDAFNTFSNALDHGLINQQTYSAATSNFNRIVQEYTAEVNGTAQAQRNFAAAQEAARRVAEEHTAQLLSTSRAFRVMGEDARFLGLRMSAFVTAPLVAAATAAIHFGGQMEVAEASLKRITGSSTIAGVQIQKMRDLALSTPFEFKDIAEGTKRLVSMGFSVRETLPLLVKLGDAVAAVGGGAPKLNALIKAFGDIQAKGRLQAEELRQLANIPIPATEILSRKLGISQAELFARMKKGLIDSRTALEALASGISERFQGQMDTLANTLPGILKNIKEKIEFAFSDIGTSLLPLEKSVALFVFNSLDKVTALAKAFGQLPVSFQLGAVGIAGLAAAAGPALFVFGTMAGSIGRLIDLGIKLKEVYGAAGLANAIGNVVNLTKTIGPLGITIAGATAAIVAFQAAQTALEIKGLAADIGALDTKFLGIDGTLRTWRETIGDLIPDIGKLREFARSLPDQVKAPLKVAFNTAVSYVDDIGKQWDNLGDLAADSLKRFAGPIAALKGAIGDIRLAIRPFLDPQAIVDVAKESKRLIDEINKQTMVGQGLAPQTQGAKVFNDQLTELSNKLRSEVKDASKEAENAIKQAFSTLKVEDFKRELAEADKAMALVGKSFTPAQLTEAIGNMEDLFLRAGRAGVLSADQIHDAVERLHKKLLEVLNNTDKPLSVQQLEFAVGQLEDRIIALKKAGVLTGDEASAAIGKLEEALRKAGIEADVAGRAIPKAFLGPDQIKTGVLALQEGNEKLAEYRKFLEDATEGQRQFIHYLEVAATSVAYNAQGVPVLNDGLEQLKTHLESTADGAGDLATAVDSATRMFEKFNARAVKDALKIKGPFEGLGIKSQAELDKAANDATAFYESIRNDSTRTSEDITRAWLAAIEAQDAAHHKLTDETINRYLRISREMGSQLSQAQHRWSEFMKDIKRLGRQFASEAFDIIWPKSKPKEILDTGAVNNLGTATGLVGEQLQGLANQIDDLAQATGGNFSSTVDKVTAQFRIWSVATDQQAKELEYLYKASNLTKTGLDALTSITAEQATALKALGFDYEHAVALIGNLNSQNVDSAKVIDNLTKAYQELEQKGYRDPGAALAQLINSIKTARSETDANAIATRHFGDAGVFMARTIRSGKLDVDKLTTAINQSAASMHDAAEETRRLNAEGGKVSKLTQLFRDLTREIAKMAAGQLAKGIADILHLEAAWRKVGKAIGGAIEALLRWIGLSKKAKDTSSAVEEGVSAIDEARKRSLDAAEKIPSVSKPPTSGGGPGLGTPPSGPGGSAGGAAGGATGWMGVVNMVTGAISAVTGVLSYLQGRRMEQDIGRIEVTTRGLLNEALNSRRDAWDQYNGMYKRLGEVWNSIKALNMGPTQPQMIGDTSYTSGFEVDQIGLMRLLVSKFDQFVIPKMDAIVALMKSMPMATAAAPATEGLVTGQTASQPQAVTPVAPRLSTSIITAAPSIEVSDELRRAVKELGRQFSVPQTVNAVPATPVIAPPAASTPPALPPPAQPAKPIRTISMAIPIAEFGRMIAKAGEKISEAVRTTVIPALPDISPQPVLATAGASNMTTAHNQTLNFYYNDRSVDTPPETVYHAKMIAKTLSNRGVRRRIRK